MHESDDWHGFSIGQQPTLCRDRWLWVGLALLLLGVAIRVALYFPLAMYQFDSERFFRGFAPFASPKATCPCSFPGAPV
jgi:hypothetical protein